MSLGGMALAIGILVDEATVTIENTHVQMGHTPNVATAVLHASNATAVPRLLALLVHPVGVHPGVHHGGPAPVAVHAADPGGRVRHDLVVPALEHVRADPVRDTCSKHQGGHGERKRRAVRPAAQGLRQGGGLVRPAALADGAGLSRGVRPGALAAGLAGRHRAVSRRSIRGNSCCGSGRRPARTSS